MNDDGIYSVSQLTEQLKRLLEGALPFVWVRGEVTNLGRPGSGHVYFSLRDGDALLNCVWFKGRQKPQEHFDPLTGEVFESGPRPCLALTIREGDTLACAGQITVFGPRGQYQLLVDMAQELGQGDLLRRLEALRRKLAARGLFDSQRKRPIPADPVRVAVITAPTGAAIQDFLRIAGTRGTGSSIRILPAPVQGPEAPGAIIRALRQATSDDWAQVVVIIRGGGSLEDLWAFNDETLVEAIAASPLPVLTGIGHEIDTSLCDLAADARAATPSHAAQLLWRERHWHAQRVDALQLELTRRVARRLDTLAERLRVQEKALGWLSPLRRIDRDHDRLLALARRLHGAQRQQLLRQETQLGTLQRRLRLRLAGEDLRAPGQAVERLARRLDAAMRRQLDERAAGLATLHARLAPLDPQAPLQRGYALILAAGGHLVHSVHDLIPGDTLRLRLADGCLDASVQNVMPDESA
ncbi:MAG TPA: exodeoxyribonuclease VII large subunit [Candidatus Avidesulfovibrio excrementigallinarum]|nr:exodeoxyribonuclease VII large subunit [Candidatus Avidesulfovibrio excrementigallinarum]